MTRTSLNTTRRVERSFSRVSDINCIPVVKKRVNLFQNQLKKLKEMDKRVIDYSVNIDRVIGVELRLEEIGKRNNLGRVVQLGSRNIDKNDTVEIIEDTIKRGCVDFTNMCKKYTDNVDTVINYISYANYIGMLDANFIANKEEFLKNKVMIKFLRDLIIHSILGNNYTTDQQFNNNIKTLVDQRKLTNNDVEDLIYGKEKNKALLKLSNVLYKTIEDTVKNIKFSIVGLENGKVPLIRDNKILSSNRGDDKKINVYHYLRHAIKEPAIFRNVLNRALHGQKNIRIHD